jgi:hypothetical protein
MEYSRQRRRGISGHSTGISTFYFVMVNCFYELILYQCSKTLYLVIVAFIYIYSFDVEIYISTHA